MGRGFKPHRAHIPKKLEHALRTFFKLLTIGFCPKKYRARVKFGLILNYVVLVRIIIVSYFKTADTLLQLKRIQFAGSNPAVSI